MSSSTATRTAYAELPTAGSENHVRHRRGSRRGRGRLLAATVIYAGAVASITLGPQPLDSGLISTLATLIEFTTASAPYAFGFADAEFLANVAMFVPFGILVARWLGGRRWILTLASGFVLSASVEAAQLFIPGRVTDVRDLVSNTLGATLGILVLAAFRGVRSLQQRTRRSQPQCTVTMDHPARSARLSSNRLQKRAP